MKTQTKENYLKPAIDILLVEVNDIVALSIESDVNADETDARVKEENWFIFRDEW